ncbi:MAG: ABC transporter permease, partial [Pseudomonas sp.]
ILGVVIGVAAVIAMVTVGQGSSRQVAASVSSLGSDVLVLRPGQRGFGPPGGGPSRRFTLRDAEALATLPVVRQVSPTANASATVVYGNANVTASITGGTDAYMQVSNWTLAEGRNFTPAEVRAGAPVCILGESTRQRLFGSASPVGQPIRVKSVSCQVIGLFAPKGAGSFGQDQDDLILMPIRLVQRRLNGDSDVNAIQISLSGGVSTSEGIRAVQALMRERRRIGLGEDDDFSVTDMKEVASMLGSVNSVLSGMLSSVAAVSLLVGGIGIMNIMLVSVTERTREIGVRMAVGARQSDILRQFLIEAVLVCLIGGTLGVLGALAFGAVFGRFTSEFSLVFSSGSIVAAFLCSTVIGLVFGFLPARNAARLDPVDALSRE